MVIVFPKQFCGTRWVGDEPVGPFRFGKTFAGLCSIFSLDPNQSSCCLVRATKQQSKSQGYPCHS